MEKNIFSSEFTEHYGAIPFSKISNEDMKEAISLGLQKAKKEIDEIAQNPEIPNFENTILALENSGEMLDRVLNVFYPLLSAASDDEMMQMSLEIAPELSNFSSSIVLNENLWKRVKHVYDNKDSADLDRVDSLSLQRKYDMFKRNGALLVDSDKERLRELNSELTKKTTLFGQNVLKELQQAEIRSSEKELEGLPERIIEGLKKKAEEKGYSGECLIGLDQPTYTAILKYAKSRSLREMVWRKYNGRNMTGEFSNVDIVRDIANLRMEQAKLLGYETFADYATEKKMAKNPEGVYALLNQLKDAYKGKCKEELAALSEFASELENRPIELKPWDYSYYFNLHKNATLDYDEEQLRPYFSLENAVEGLFFLAKTLYGLSFTPLEDADKYEEDVRVYNVTDSDGTHIGLLYMDFHPRDNKRNGAWMTNFREQKITNGENIRPLVSIVTNLTKPTDAMPSLLSPSEVRTLLHEFGHALHGLLSQTKYASMSGTNVARDFVELPSQFNENFILEREFLKKIGKHYQTGETIPDELIEKIINVEQEGAGYACMRQLQFGFLDMAWHTIKEKMTKGMAEFENEAIGEIAPFPAENNTSVSPQFSHIFSGGYAAGYYSYKWSEVLDADAFSRFKEEGIFNKETANSFRKEILERGSSEEPEVLFKNFRGRNPQIEALMKRDGVMK